MRVVQGHVAAKVAHIGLRVEVRHAQRLHQGGMGMAEFVPRDLDVQTRRNWIQYPVGDVLQHVVMAGLRTKHEVIWSYMVPARGAPSVRPLPWRAAARHGYGQGSWSGRICPCNNPRGCGPLWAPGFRRPQRRLRPPGSGDANEAPRTPPGSTHSTLPVEPSRAPPGADGRAAPRAAPCTVRPWRRAFAA